MSSIFTQTSIIYGSPELVDLFRKYAPSGLILRSNIHKFNIYYDNTTKRYTHKPDRGRISEIDGVWLAMTRPYYSFVVIHPPLLNLCKLH